MSSPRSEATLSFDVSIISQWQVLGLPVKISQRLARDEYFHVVVQHLSDNIAINNVPIEEYEQAIREFTATIDILTPVYLCCNCRRKEQNFTYRV